MGIYANILGHEVKMNNLMAEAVRQVRKLEPEQYIADDSDHCATFSRKEIAVVINHMVLNLVATKKQRDYCLGELIAWFQLSEEEDLTFG